MIILDTDAMTFLERRGSAVSAQLRERLTRLSAEHDIVTTVITYEEQARGWMASFARARRPMEIVNAYRDLLEHLDMFKTVSVIPYSDDADLIFTGLRRLKLRIGTRDLRIAAVALSHHATLFTRNLRDFSQVAGLDAEDWTAD